jgi:hypothetical protein
MLRCRTPQVRVESVDQYIRLQTASTLPADVASAKRGRVWRVSRVTLLNSCLEKTERSRSWMQFARRLIEVMLSPCALLARTVTRSFQYKQQQQRALGLLGSCRSYTDSTSASSTMATPGSAAQEFDLVTIGAGGCCPADEAASTTPCCSCM